MTESPKGLNTLDDFNNPEGVFPLPVLKMLLIQHAEVQAVFQDKLVQCFDLKEPTYMPRISGEQAEWLISRVPEEDRVSHPLREVEKGDGPSNRSQITSIFYEMHSYHQIASELIQKRNLSLQAADEAQQSQELQKQLTEVSQELTKARKDILAKINSDAYKKVAKEKDSAEDRITNNDLEGVNKMLNEIVTGTFHLTPAALYSVSASVLFAKAGIAPFKDIAAATASSVQQHITIEDRESPTATPSRAPRTVKEIQKQQRKQSSLLQNRGTSEDQNEVMQMQKELGYGSLFVPVADHINANAPFGEKLVEEDKGAQLVERIVLQLELKPLINKAIEIKWHVSATLNMKLTQLDCIEEQSSKVIQQIAETKTKLMYRTQVTTSVATARAAQQRSTIEGGDGAFLTHAFSPDPYLLLATNVEQTFKHIGRTANEIALFCSTSLHHHAAAFTNSRVLALSLLGDGLNYDASKETPHQYFLRQIARFNITQSQQTSMPGISNPMFATGVFESTLIYHAHTEIQRAASGVAGKKALTNDNKKRIKKELTEFNKRKTDYKGGLQVTDPTYIAEIFGGPSQAIDAFSSLLQTISDQFTVSPSEQGNFTYKELEDFISLIASGQRNVEVSTSSSSGASSFKAQGGPEKQSNSTKSTSSDEEALRRSAQNYTVQFACLRNYVQSLYKQEHSAAPHKTSMYLRIGGSQFHTIRTRLSPALHHGAPK